MNNVAEREIYFVDTGDHLEEVVLRYDEYEESSSLAVALYARPNYFRETGDVNPRTEDVDVFSELYAVITVNLPDSIVLPQGTQFIDTNNYPWVYNWLIENGIAEPTEYCARSGFCLYPAMKFRQCRLTVK